MHILTFNSLGKKKNGMAMTTRETPQMRNPPHHIPTQWRSLESERKRTGENYDSSCMYRYLNMNVRQKVVLS